MMRAKLRQKLARQKAFEARYPHTGLPVWLGWHRKTIPLTRGQKAKAGREFKGMLDKVLGDIYASSAPNWMVVSQDFSQAFDAHNSIAREQTA